MELETVKITADVTAENLLGYIVINKTDLTEEHELFDESAKKAKGKKTAAATTDTNGDCTTDTTTTQGGNEGA
ncbi:hypothetical protein [Aquitalea aquatica]|uniref:Uncharacterized protein n=1 Tax=Aquitalea aquatica TaxID=3044273 RepID=A0A838Y4I9_9NEIS|nr:hypothetical protein [Aquitalea magnusonii]MBA4707519.1 hypothetical protein [Aquitalea magnusonii]